MDSEIVERWLTKNTVHCPLGRIPRDTCEALRARPNFKQAVNGEWSQRKTEQFRVRMFELYMPELCETCEGWDYYRDKEEKQMPAELQIKEPKLVKCRVCGEEYPETKRVFLLKWPRVFRPPVQELQEKSQTEKQTNRGCGQDRWTSRVQPAP